MQNLQNWNANHLHLMTFYSFHLYFHFSFFFLLMSSVHSIYWYQQFFWLSKSWTILLEFSVLSHFSSWNFLFIQTFYWLRQCMSIDWIDEFDRKYRSYSYAFRRSSSYKYENRFDSDRCSAIWPNLLCLERSSFRFWGNFRTHFYKHAWFWRNWEVFRSLDVEWFRFRKIRMFIVCLHEEIREQRSRHCRKCSWNLEWSSRIEDFLIRWFTARFWSWRMRFLMHDIAREATLLSWHLIAYIYQLMSAKFVWCLISFH